MKAKVAAVVAVLVIAVGALMLFRGGSDEPAPMDAKYWTGDHCPITGKKYDDADENDAMQGNIPLRFKHEGIEYEAYVWNEAAIDEFEQNRDKYLPKIVGKSE